VAAIALVRLLARRCSSRIRPSSAVTEFVGGAIAVQQFRLQEWAGSVTRVGRLDLRLRLTGIGDRALGLQFHREKPGCRDR